MDEKNTELLELVQQLENHCHYFEEVIQRQIEVKDSQIDRLHSEVQDYQKDTSARYIQKVMLDVIRILCRMKKRSQTAQWQQMSADELRREYHYAMEDLTDLLQFQGIDAFTTQPGETFDPARHNPKIEATDDPALDKTVKESQQDGFEQGGKVIVPEKVIVYQYKGEAL